MIPQKVPLSCGDPQNKKVDPGAELIFSVAGVLGGRHSHVR